jgi:hypothetical protein
MTGRAELPAWVLSVAGRRVSLDQVEERLRALNPGDISRKLPDFERRRADVVRTVAYGLKAIGKARRAIKDGEAVELELDIARDQLHHAEGVIQRAQTELRKAEIAGSYSGGSGNKKGVGEKSDREAEHRQWWIEVFEYKREHSYENSICSMTRAINECIKKRVKEQLISAAKVPDRSTVYRWIKPYIDGTKT